MQHLLVYLLFTGIYQGPHQPETAQVQRLMGIGIYVNSVPVREYDTVMIGKGKRKKPYYITTRKDFNTYPGISTENKVRGIEAALENLAYKAVRKSKKLGINAIITNDCKTAIAIKFKPVTNDNIIDKAKVSEVKGIKIFVKNEPVQSYEVLYDVKIADKLDFNFIGYTDMNEMLEKLVDEAQKKGDCDALITTNALHAKAIRFIKK